MRTQKQIAASRENGGKSHGAATAEGKARIVNANSIPGIFAGNPSPHLGIPEDLRELKDEYYARHPPAPRGALPPRPDHHVRMHLRRFVSVEMP